MYNGLKLFRLIENLSIAISVVSIILLFFNLFFSLFFAVLSSVLSSVGMLMYLFKKEYFGFSKVLFYSLLISSASVLIIFFKLLKT